MEKSPSPKRNAEPFKYVQGLKNVTDDFSSRGKFKVRKTSRQDTGPTYQVEERRRPTVGPVRTGLRNSPSNELDKGLHEGSVPGVPKSDEVPGVPVVSPVRTSFGS